GYAGVALLVHLDLEAGQVRHLAGDLDEAALRVQPEFLRDRDIAASDVDLHRRSLRSAWSLAGIDATPPAGGCKWRVDRSPRRCRGGTIAAMAPTIAAIAPDLSWTLSPLVLVVAAL